MKIKIQSDDEIKKRIKEYIGWQLVFMFFIFIIVIILIFRSPTIQDEIYGTVMLILAAVTFYSFSIKENILINRLEMRRLMK